jgi:ABC-type dipeptide/oligopeptide/nickel transport system permease subunit
MAAEGTVARPFDPVARQWTTGPASRYWKATRHFIRANPTAAFAAAFLAVVALCALAAPLVTTYDPNAIAPLERLQGPSTKHWLGTDNIGRDMFSRIVWGSRISLTVGFWVVLFGTGTGTLIGLVSGYYGGKVDMVIQRFVDAFQAFPALLMALALVSILGASQRNVIIAIAVVMAPYDSRVIRSAVLQLRGTDFVAAARSVGASDRRLMFRHVAPNIVAPLIIIASVDFGAAILIEAALSFLGLGTPPPAPSWGSMLSGSGRAYMEVLPTLAIFPGLAISLTVLAFNLFGDGLRDVLDPRMRGRA